MDGLGYACAVLLAAVFVRAAAAKLARPAATDAGFTALGLPAPGATARAVPLVELAVAAALLAAPRVGAGVAVVLLAVFSAFLAGAVRSGLGAPCNCFGAVHADPVSWADVIRNALLVGLAALATVPARPVAPGLTETVVAAGLFAAGCGILAACRRRRSP